MDNDIKIPLELSEGELTLEEIGTIVVLMCIPSLDKNVVTQWQESGILQSNIDNLKDQGIIKISDNHLDIDFTKISKNDFDFWVVYDHDENGNTIFGHPSDFGDEDGRYWYLLKQNFRDDTLTYTLSHSEYGIIEEIVYSKDEAKEMVKFEIDQNGQR
jgi:hypothetical protein